MGRSWPVTLCGPYPATLLRAIGQAAILIGAAVLAESLGQRDFQGQEGRLQGGVGALSHHVLF